MGGPDHESAAKRHCGIDGRGTMERRSTAASRSRKSLWEGRKAGAPRRGFSERVSSALSQDAPPGVRFDTARCFSRLYEGAFGMSTPWGEGWAFLFDEMMPGMLA